MLEITRHLRIDENEFEWSFVRAGGPGGQNVNKVASKAVLRWNIVSSPSLPPAVKHRFLSAYRSRVTQEGDLLVTSQRFRDQEKNRQDCLEKLRELLRQAALPPKPRRPTRPTRASREARLRLKRQRAQAKTRRRLPSEE